MNKKSVIVISILILSVLTAGCHSSKENADAALSEEDAKKIALEDANVSENDISHIHITLDNDDGALEYEVEFYASNEEYDYSIDATTGKILSKDREIENDFNHENSGSDANSQNDSNNPGIISEQDAKQIALAKVSGATEQNIRIRLEQDDGRQIYEGSIYHNEKEYEFEIDATNGNVISWEEESIYD